MMNILITGGCGFLGSNIAYKLLSDKKKTIHILDNLSRNGTDLNLKWLKENGLENFHLVDIRDSKKIDSLINEIKPHFVFHLAGQVAMTTSIENPKTDFEINAMGSLNLLEALRKYNPNAGVIYSSTNKVYGDLEQYTYIEMDKRYVIEEDILEFSEQEPLNFHSPYGCSKGSADQYMLDYYRLFGLKTVVFRHSSMYGGRQFATYDQGWIGWFVQKAVEIKLNKPNVYFSISGNGKQVRDVLHADDAVDLYILAMNYIDKIEGMAFNIGGGYDNSLSLLELFDILESELNIKMIYDQIPPRQSDQKIFIAKNQKYTQITGWQPKISKQEGIKKMITWLQTIVQ